MGPLNDFPLVLTKQTGGRGREPLPEAQQQPGINTEARARRGRDPLRLFPSPDRLGLASGLTIMPAIPDAGGNGSPTDVCVWARARRGIDRSSIK